MAAGRAARFASALKHQLDYGGCSENAEDLEVLMLYWWNRRNRKRTRYWVHPINHQRRGSGVMSKLFAELREDEEKFGNYVRMCTDSFDHILSLGSCSVLPYRTLDAACETIEFR